MGKGKVAVKILLSYNLSEVKGPKRAEQDYDQINIYPVTSWLLSQKQIGVTALWKLTAFDYEKQEEEGLWFLYIPAGGQCKW